MVQPMSSFWAHEAPLGPFLPAVIFNNSGKDLNIRLGIVRWDFMGNLLEVRALSGHLWHGNFTLVLRDVCALDKLGKPSHYAGHGP